MTDDQTAAATTAGISMLAARPGAAQDPSATLEPTEEIRKVPQARRTMAKKLRRKAELAEAREKIRQSIAARPPVPPLKHPPLYDDIFFRGLEELVAPKTRTEMSTKISQIQREMRANRRNARGRDTEPSHPSSGLLSALATCVAIPFPPRPEERGSR